VDAEGVTVTGDARTGSATIAVDGGGENLIIVDPDPERRPMPQSGAGEVRRAPTAP
jgi:sugar/nucleoside kinase (ribokinase family)